MSNWILLFIAGLFETAWAIGLKYSDGFKKPLISVITVACMIISMGTLGFALKELPVGTAYAVWTGIGAAGTAILGIIIFNEPKDLGRIISLVFIIIGIIGLKYFNR